MSSGITVILLALFLIGCSSQSGPEVPPIQEAYSKDQLIPLAVGNAWRYRDVGNFSTTFRSVDFPETIAVLKQLPMYEPSKGDLYHTYRGDRVWYGQSQNDYATYLSVSDNELVVGAHYQESNGQRVVQRANLSKNPVAGEVFVPNPTADQPDTLEWLLGQETITCPAGTFDCYRLARYPATGGAFVYYFARGVGLVRMENQGATVPSYRELTSYIVK